MITIMMIRMVVTIMIIIIMVIPSYILNVTKTWYKHKIHEPSLHPRIVFLDIAY